MRDCVNAEVRDRLPELVHGRLEEAERAAIESHVAECPDCAAEAALIRLVAGSVAAGLPKMNASRIAASIVPATVRTAPRRQVLRGGTLRWAAGFVVAVIGIGALQLFNTPGTNDVASRPLPAESTDRAVARPITGPATNGYAVSGARSGLVLVGGIDALSLDQLEALVTGVETLSSVPTAEPEPLPLGSEEAR